MLVQQVDEMNYKIAVVHGANPKQVHAQNRAHAGANLYKEGKVHVVVTTGRYEAGDLAQIVLKDGVPENAIRLETKSKTTYQNLRNLVSETFPSLEDSDHRLELAYLISQEWHEPRLLYIARHVLGRRYHHEFYAVEDGRKDDEKNSDIALERYKIWVDRTTISLPWVGGLVNSLAYLALSKVRR